MRGFQKCSWGDKIAPRYDLFYGKHSDAESVVDFLTSLNSGKTGILDVGAGTGSVAALLSQRLDAEVAALDVSRAMLAMLEQRNEQRVRPIHLDICEAAPQISVDLSYCIFNTLFMVGDLGAQAEALKNIRSITVPGGQLVIEAFQPIGEFFAKDSFTMEPLDMGADEILMTLTRVRAQERVIEGQDLYIAEGGNTLAPCIFHYRSVEEIDADAKAAGWQLVERYASWDKAEFSDDSESALSVYEAV